MTCMATLSESAYQCFTIHQAQKCVHRTQMPHTPICQVPNSVPITMSILKLDG